MSAPGPREAIAPEALQAIERLESERGAREDFLVADAEWRRLEGQWNLHRFAAYTCFLGGIVALHWMEGAAGIWGMAAILEGWRRTPHGRAIKRVKQAVLDWLAFGQTS